ncbi:hypothetical protein GUITHDRAFT_143755 [Guillardia theta CCMP2712]|uniref:Alpha-ketoglutarate-dependent dioxygenase AlkB-like domain-containing protein n=1 Tax=Guillardia theta (strain CCMP2712) TaxID=905079 RepID=L1ISD5_GUITC|nr:hypothetical protein GUITHDRAFT_143755 [Guillardia theta CCMP2712]EKX39153.1 hypothetical protein GUITHDRAFT_143755 [Guillardia theta CCMP2712]|eukprot:XP_005826133.1 hypothetical protein GUITHDRAFT_143755 [Guillardia theta CCMP2712]
MENFRQLQFCNGCNVCVLPWELAGHSCVRQRVLNGRNNHTLGHMGCSFQGVTVVEEFITEEVEGCWVREMDRDDRLWILSQSGRRKQEFGPKVNFKKEEVKIDPSGTIFPSWSQEFLQLCSSSSSLLSDFEAVELGLLEYEPLRGSCIAPHIDDSW